MKEIYDKLRDDEHYYGDFGKQFLSNSDISTLLKNPKDLHKPKPSSPALLVGGYFHTAILEPDKLNRFKIVEATTRNTKAYKEISEGELCLLQHEVDKIQLMTEAIQNNDVCRDLIKPILGEVDYEEPRVQKIHGQMWKGKADIVNHDDKLVIDLKTTSDINSFKRSAYRWNYDSQAYIYSKLFIVIDKETHQIGLFDCSPDFYAKGEDKVRRACDAYELFYQTDNFDHKQHLLTKTL